MILTDAVQLVRDSLDDTKLNVSQSTWSDAEIVRHIDEALRGMYRRMIHSNKEWSNMFMALNMSSARTMFQNGYEWRLPSWVEAVTKVYEQSDSGSGVSTFSPYLWASTSAIDLKREIPKSDKTRQHGWTWEGNHTFRLWDWTTTPNLVLAIAVPPTPMFKARVQTIRSKANGLYLPEELDLGTLYREEGRYINADIQVTETASATAAWFGEVRRVVYSTSARVDSGVRYNELIVDSDFSGVIAQNDVVESVLPISDLHSRLLTLRVVNACALKNANLPLQRYISDELRSEEMAFMEYAEAPRDKAGPYFYTTSTLGRRSWDPNRRNWGWGWGFGY